MNKLLLFFSDVFLPLLGYSQNDYPEPAKKHLPRTIFTFNHY